MSKKTKFQDEIGHFNGKIELSVENESIREKQKVGTRASGKEDAENKTIVVQSKDQRNFRLLLKKIYNIKYARSGKKSIWRNEL